METKLVSSKELMSGLLQRLWLMIEETEKKEKEGKERDFKDMDKS
jgi:hypothetical protein